ncbi:MAG TPA: L-aspartate oxidase [Spirochaetota bacterium]|nr:L-aspartate oxidase [Spirochaetota bacterium]HPJ36731.1 L-aspartate oxidase [Spirochaetota bacterium]
MRHYYDAVVVGSGIAGLTCAIYLKMSGFDVIVMTKNSDISETNTFYAQGGIIAAKEDDSPSLLRDDVLQAGCSFNRTDAVNYFASYGPQLVFDFLVKLAGIEFSISEDGNIDYTEEAAHSVRRIVHYEDHTGDKIEVSLIDYAKKLGVKFFVDYTAVDLITNNHHSRNTQEVYREREVMGIYALNNRTTEAETFFADNVILATGGIGNLYYHSTNPVSATGDGMSMAYRAGADIINAEFVQFHPTSLFHKDIKRFLISESLRGEGARLKDHSGREFMYDYSEMGHLAPRDVVARGIYDRMSRDGKEYMLLDIANFYEGSVPLEKRFSKIYSTCKNGGIDIAKEPIPIVPAAHYFCGGIKTDLKGKTSLKNLYAVGEVACTGLHGANRLASTSLLEGVLWGKSAAEDITAKKYRINKARYKSIPDWEEPEYTEEFDPLLIDQDMKAIQLTMWNYAGIIRTEKGLRRAEADLDYYSHRIMRFYKSARLHKNIIELRNSVVSSLLIVRAALRNTSSVGCHYIKK